MEKSDAGAPFAAIKDLPPDAIFGTSKHPFSYISIAMKAKYKADNNPKKVGLTVGAYRTSEGKPWILPVVHQVLHFNFN